MHRSFKHSINSVHICVVFLFLHYISIIGSHSNSIYQGTVECLIFALLREFREAPYVRQNKTRQIKYNACIQK